MHESIIVRSVDCIYRYMKAPVSLIVIICLVSELGVSAGKEAHVAVVET